MSSLRRILSSRANGARSTGPKTPEGRARSRLEAGEKRARRLQQHERAHDVRVDEGPRAVDRPIDVRLRRQIQHCGRPVRVSSGPDGRFTPGSLGPRTATGRCRRLAGAG